MMGWSVSRCQRQEKRLTLSLLGLSLTCFAIVQCNGSITPSNTAGFVGNPMALGCSPGEGIRFFKWMHRSSTGSQYQPVLSITKNSLQIERNYSHFKRSVDDVGTEYIYTNSTMFQDAGLYVCETDKSKNSAHVIVFENEPKCETNYTSNDNNVTTVYGDSIWIRCSINYNGMWTPEVEWRQHTIKDGMGSDTGRIVGHGVSKLHTPLSYGFTISSTLVVAADFTEKTYFSCKFYFDKDNPQRQSTAANSPSLNPTCKSPEMVLSGADFGDVGERSSNRNGYKFSGKIVPQNTAVVAGNSMALECLAGEDNRVLRWMYRSPNGTEYQTFLSIAKNSVQIKRDRSHFSWNVDDSGSGYIYTNSTKLGDAGLYVCETDKYHSSAHVIVFESEPKCETNYTSNDNNVTIVHGDSVWLRCSINYNGMWHPEVEWRQHTLKEGMDNRTGLVVKHGVSTTSEKLSLGSSISSTLIVAVDFTDTTYFSCKFYFDMKDKQGPKTVENVPVLSPTCKSPNMMLPIMGTIANEDIDDISSVPAVAPLLANEDPGQSENTNTNWHTISIVLCIVLIAFVLVVFGSIGRIFHTRLRRIQGNSGLAFNAVYFSGLEKSSLDPEDIPPFPAANVYDQIEEITEEDEAPAAPPARQHPPLTRCYSHLSQCTQPSQSEPYEDLNLCQPMDHSKKIAPRETLGVSTFLLSTDLTMKEPNLDKHVKCESKLVDHGDYLDPTIYTESTSDDYLRPIDIRVSVQPNAV